MSLRTITKIACFVISAIAAPLFLSSCSGISYGGNESADANAQNSPFLPPEIIARIASKKVTESSGLAVSKCQDDVFWTHNDSGDGPFIYAFDSKGKDLGTWRVSAAVNVDWEDMATIKGPNGNCFLYIGEIGDNERKRDLRVIYRIAEPVIGDRLAVNSAVQTTVESEVLRFSYPEGRNDAEALLVHPTTGDIYVVTKKYEGSAEVFKLKPDFGNKQIQTAEKVTDISLPAIAVGMVTGGDISPDGKRLILSDYLSGYEFEMPKNAKSFDDVWLSKPTTFNLGPRQIGESIAFGHDANVVFATTEKASPPLICVNRK